jgi:DnaJ-class molecular chaperone
MDGEDFFDEPEYCELCEGSGVDPFSDNPNDDCPECGGSGLYEGGY